MKTLLILTTLLFISCSSLKEQNNSEPEEKLCKAYTCYIDSLPHNG